MDHPDPSNYVYFSRIFCFYHSSKQARRTNQSVCLLAVLNTIGVGVASLASGRRSAGGLSGGGSRRGHWGGGGSGRGSGTGDGGSLTVVVIDVENASGGLGRGSGGVGRDDGRSVGVDTGGLDGRGGNVSDTHVTALGDFLSVDV